MIDLKETTIDLTETLKAEDNQDLIITETDREIETTKETEEKEEITIELTTETTTDNREPTTITDLPDNIRKKDNKIEKEEPLFRGPRFLTSAQLRKGSILSSR